MVWKRAEARKCLRPRGPTTSTSAILASARVISIPLRFQRFNKVMIITILPGKPAMQSLLTRLANMDLYLRNPCPLWMMTRDVPSPTLKRYFPESNVTSTDDSVSGDLLDRTLTVHIASERSLNESRLAVEQNVRRLSWKMVLDMMITLGLRLLN